MPNRPNTPCKHPGCAALVPYGEKYCEVHKPQHPEEVWSAAGRGYGRTWQRARKERAHECYHYEEHYLFFCLQEMGSKDWTLVMDTPVSDVVTERSLSEQNITEGDFQMFCERMAEVSFFGIIQISG